MLIKVKNNYCFNKKFELFISKRRQVCTSRLTCELPLKTFFCGVMQVIMKPLVVEYLNATGVMGRETSLTCKASGDPLPEVMFLKEGTLIPFSQGIQNYDDRYFSKKSFFIFLFGILINSNFN